MLYICNRVQECDSITCDHKKPHELYCLTHRSSKCNCDGKNNCDKKDTCGRVVGYVKCIPIFKDFIKEGEMEI